MVNFKSIGLPLLLLLTGGRMVRGDEEPAVPECKITVSGENCTPGEKCTESNNAGFHLITTNTTINGNQIINVDEEGILVKLTYPGEGSPTCEIHNTPGYYAITDSEFNGKYIQCSRLNEASVKCVMKAVPTTSTCNKDNVGKIIGGPKLCIGQFDVTATTEQPNYKELELSSSDSEGSKKMLVQHSSDYNNTVFSFAQEANYYGVEVGVDSVVFSEAIDGKDLTSLKSGVIVSRKKEHCSADKSGKYYDCNKGICTSRKQNTREIEYNGETPCTITYKSNKFTLIKTASCVPKKTGYYLLKTTEKTTDPITEVTSTGDGKNVYVYYDRNANTFTVKGPKTGKIYFFNKAEKSRGSYALVECDSTKCNLTNTGPPNKNYFVDADDGSLIIKSGSRYINDASKKKGYYFNDASKKNDAAVNVVGTVVACNGSVCEEYASSKYYSNCNTNSIGGVKYNKGVFSVCVGYNEITNVAIEKIYSQSQNDIGTFIIGSPKKFPGVTDGKAILVEKKGSMVTLVTEQQECKYDGMIVKKKDEDYFIYCANVVKTVKITTEGEGSTETKYEATEFKFEKDGARFVHKVGGAYKVIQLEADGFSYVDKPEGYFLDRTGKIITITDDVSDEVKGQSTTVIYCDGVNCNPVDVNNLQGTDFFANAETKLETGTIIKCTEQTVAAASRKREEGETYIECKVSTAAAGYYTNHKRELIKCTATACEYTDGVNYKRVTSVSDIDYYLNAGVGESSVEALLQCTVGEGCKTIPPISTEAMADCYTGEKSESETRRACAEKLRFVNGGEGNYSIIQCALTYADDALSTAKCESLPSSIQYVFYVSEEYSKDNVGRLIKCYRNDRCEYGVDSDRGSYINASDNKKVITCDNGNACKTEDGVKYYSDGYQKKLSLIYCDGSSCSSVTGSVRDVFISGTEKLLHYDSVTERFEVIEEPATPYTDAECTETTKAKEFYYLNGSAADKKDGSPLIKLSFGCEKEAAASRKREGETYKAKTKVEPIAGEKDQLYDNGNSEGLDHAFIFCTDTKVCNEVSASDGEWYVDKTDAKLYKCDENGCSAGTENDNMAEYLDAEGKTIGLLVDAASNLVLDDNNLSRSKLIKCTKTVETSGESRTTKLVCDEVTQGNEYFVNPKIANSLVYIDGSSVGIMKDATQGYFNIDATDKNIIYCSGGSDVCSIYTVESGSCTDAGSVASGKFCIGAAAGTEGKKYINKLGNDENRLVNYKSSSVVVLEKPSAVSYFITNESGEVLDTAGVSTTKLYKCETTGSCSSLEIGKNIYMNGDVTSTIPYISCTAANAESEIAACQLTSTSDEEYCLNGNKLYSCKAEGCGSDNKVITANAATKCSEITYKAGLYVPYMNNQLINCSTSTSTSYCSLVSSLSLAETYYISADVNKPLIRCRKSLDKYVCESVSTKVDGYYLGSTIIGGKNILIGCVGKICSEVGSPSGFYVSGDTTIGRLIYCVSSNCYAYAKPKEGYYINAIYGDVNSESRKDGKKLIKCDATTCTEVKAPGQGYVLNAAKDMGKSSKQLIQVDSEDPEEVLVNIDDVLYYNSASSDGVMIKCKGKECATLTTANVGWYRMVQSKNQLIGCKIVTGTTVGCELYQVSNLGMGYYYNAGEGSYPLFEVKSEYAFDSSAEPHSYYVNADTNSAENAIACMSEKECSLVKAETAACSNNNAGKLSTGHGGLVYCKGGDGVTYEKLVDEEAIVMVPAKNIPMSVPQDTAFVAMQVYDDHVVHVKINGYEYYGGKLYFCTDDNVGVCVDKSSDIKPGYFFRYNTGKLNSKIWRCEDGACEEFKRDINYEINCTYSNVIIDDDKIKLCIKDGNKIDLSDLKISYLYALETKESLKDDEITDSIYRGYRFPGRSGNRYIMAVVSKYTVLYDSDITEIENECGLENKEVADPKVYCIKNNKVYLESNVGSVVSGEIDVAPKDGKEIKSIVYGYETNDGWLNYKDSRLLKVHISIDSTYKYECEIGGTCIKKEKQVDPPRSFKENNGALIKVDSSDKESVVDGKIADGTYYTQASSNSRKRATGDGFIECVNNFCTSKGSSPFAQLKSDGKVLSYGYENKKMGFEKLYFLVTTGGKSKVYELTNASFSEVNTGVRNIFLDNHNQIISNGDQDISLFFKCNAESCTAITKQNCVKEYYLNTYYLNTVQTDKQEGKNALVECTSSGMSFIHCSEINGERIYENGAADSKSNAIIRCTDKTCFVEEVTTEGIPECEEIATGCARADTHLLLKDGQYCYDSITKKIKTSGSQCVDAVFDGDVVILDATLRVMSDKTRSHYGASMYKRDSEGKWYRTFGYSYDTTTKNVLKCENDGCIKMEDAELNAKCSVVGAGHVILDGNDLKICTSSGTSVAVQSSGEKVYPMTVDTKNDFPEMESGNEILVGVSKTVAYVISSDKYVNYHSTNNVISNGSPAGNTLYLCEGDNWRCSKVESPQNGYYLSSFMGSNVIKVSGNTITTVAKDNSLVFTYGTYKYYAGSATSVFGNVNVMTKADGKKIVVEKLNGFVLINENKLAVQDDVVNVNEGDQYGLYQCNDEIGSCNPVNVDDAWYYLEDGKAIRCESNRCVIRKLANKCDAFGDLIFDAKKYQICGNSGTSKTPAKVELKTGTSYYIENRGTKEISFPNQKNYVVAVNQAVIGIGVIDAKGTTKLLALPDCASCDGKKGTNGKYCKCPVNKSKPELGSNIYKGNASGGNDKQFTDLNKNTVVVFNGEDLATGETGYTPTIGSQMFICKKSGACFLTEGYVKFKTSYYECKFTGCDAVSGTKTKIGQLNSGKLISSNGNNGAFGSTETLYHYIEGSNEFPGSEKYVSFLVEAGENYMVINTEEGQYLIDNSGKKYYTDPQPAPTAPANQRRDVIEEVYEIEEENATEREEVTPVEDGSIGIEEAENIEFVNEVNEVNAGFEMRATTTGSLYKCDGSSCSKITNPANGYYLNSASVQENNNNSNYKNSALIECKGGSCYIAEEIEFDTDNCNNSTLTPVGTLIRKKRTESKGVVTKYNEYQLCTNDGAVSLFTSASSKLMTISAGEKFLNVDLSEEDDDSEKKVNIILKYGTKSVEQFDKTGYILTKSDKDYEIVDKLASTQQNILHKCSGNPVSCEKVKNVNNGWYFNNELFGDNRYIKCVNGKCGVTAAAETCTDSGSIIYSNGLHRVCVTRDSQLIINNLSTTTTTSIVMNVSSNKVFPGVDSSNVDILVEMTNESVQFIKSNSYVVTEETSISDATVAGDGTIGKLYKCIAGYCEYDKLPSLGWYLKYNNEGKADQLVNCDNSGCKLVTSVDEGFYVSAKRDMPLIQCATPRKDGINQSGVTECFERDYMEGWYLGGKVPLVECSKEEGCKEHASAVPGWYLNNDDFALGAEFNRTIHKVIKCSSSDACEEYKNDLKKDCDETKPTTTAENGDITFASNKYKLCLSKAKINKVLLKQVELSTASGTDKYVITIESSDSFASGTVIVEVGQKYVRLVEHSDQKYYLLNNGSTTNTLYKCSSGTCEVEEAPTVDGIVRYDANKGNLISYKANKWDVLKEEGFVFITADETIVTNTEEHEPSKLYSCRKDAKNNYRCRDMAPEDQEMPEGYYYNTKIVKGKSTDPKWYGYIEGSWAVIQDNKKEIQKCTKVSYKNNVCYMSYDNEPSGTDGKEIAAGNICIDGDTIYFAISKIDTGIKDEENCIKIDTKASDTSTKYYRVGSKDIYGVDKYGVYKINTSDSDNDNVIDTMTSKVVLFEKTDIEFSGYIKPYDYGVFAEKIINCVGGSCKLDNVNSCAYDFKTEKCTYSGKAGDLCISKLNNVYVMKKASTDEAPCLRYDSLKRSQEGEGGTAVAGKNYSVIDGKMYYIDGNQVVYVAGEGVYVLDEADRIVEVHDKIKFKDSVFRLIVCNKEGCVERESCANGALNEYIYDQDVLYRCDPTKNVLEKVSIGAGAVGYYLNNPWNNIIKCFNNYKLEVECTLINSDRGMEGYYKDVGNDGRMIKCVRSNNEFKCESEEMVACEYSEGKCVSEVDLLSNSYCYDKTSKKLAYVENYIRKQDSGDCIVGESSDRFFSYKSSKFLGHEARNDLIKVNENSIVSVYEKELGYYVVSTKTGKGMTSSDDKEFNKSRMYKCEESGCVEVVDPVSGNIYINKASDQRLIEFDGVSRQWNVIDQRCEVRSENVYQCTVNNEIGDKGIIYLTDDVRTKLYKSNSVKSYYNNKNSKNYMITPENEYSNDKYVQLSEDKYQYVVLNSGVPNVEGDADKKLYYYHRNGQIIEIEDQEGYYVFDGDGELSYTNMIGASSNTNVTTTYKFLKYSDGLYRSDNVESLDDGYYMNRADHLKRGLYLEVMHIVEKPDEPEENDESTARRKRSNEGDLTSKLVNNLCTSVKKNVCVNTQGSKIQKGDACIVRDGEFSGIYLATKEITNNAQQKDVNCIKYDEENVYYYVKDNVKDKEFNNYEFAADRTISNIIIEVGKDSINVIKSNDDNNLNGSLYVIGDDNKLLSSEKEKTATGIICKDRELQDGTVYQCKEEAVKNKFYYSDVIGKVVYYSNAGWKVVNSGYQFWNKDMTGSRVTEVDTEKDNVDVVVGGSSNGSTNILEGVYINAMADELNIVDVDSDGSLSLIGKEERKVCKIENKKCKAVGEVELVDGKYCIDQTNKVVYLTVEEDSNASGDGAENKEIVCYTGKSSDVVYRLSGDVLYRLDGLSTQKLLDGWFILNEQNKAFTSSYAEKAKTIIQCSGGYCEEKDKVESESVIVNAANGKLMKVYNEVYFVNIVKPGYYYVGESEKIIYLIMDDGTIVGGVEEGEHEVTISGNKVVYNYDKNNIYVDNVSNKIVKGDGTAIENANLKYDEDGDVITYKEKSNAKGDTNIFVIVSDGTDSTIYKIMKNEFEMVEDGLYLITEDGEPYTSDEMDKIETFCYSVGGKCDNEMLANIKKNYKPKFFINKATTPVSVVENDSEEDTWRMVKEDGYYFFFEGDYSISESNNRIGRVLKIEDENVIDVSDRTGAEGFYLFDELMVEANVEGWEDAKKKITTVFVGESGKCESYDPALSIENGNLCYSEKDGLCIMKSNKSSVSANCKFSENESENYYLVGDQLYKYNENSYLKVKRQGLFVVDKRGSIMKSGIESNGIAFICKKGVCERVEELETQYYLNMASDNEDAYVVLRYNKKNMMWAKSNVNGYYFFNQYGSPVVEGEEVKYVFMVKNNGNTIVNVSENSADGTFVDNSNVNDPIIIKRKGKWGKAEHVSKCKIVSNYITSNVSMKAGDLCLDDKKLVIIKSARNQKRDDTYSYEGIVVAEAKGVYKYNEKDKVIEVVEDNSIVAVDITGYVVLDKSTQKPLTATKDTGCDVYKCSGTKCESWNKSKYVVNELSEEILLIEYASGSCKVVTTEGFYFLDENLNAVGNNGRVGSAYHVSMRGQDKMEVVSSVGVYFNKASKEKIIVTDDGKLWSNGSSLTSDTINKCTVEKDDNSGNVCKTLKEEISYEKGSYCIAQDKLYLILDTAEFNTDVSNCISGKNGSPEYIKDMTDFMGGTIASNMIIEVTEDAIRIVDNGYYIFDENNKIVEEKDMANPEVTKNVVKCYAKDGCNSVSIEAGNVILTGNGNIYIADMESPSEKLLPVEEEGLYFFVDGESSNAESNAVSDIIRVSKNGNEIVKEKLMLDELEKGVYVNAARNTVIGIYDGEEWTFKDDTCEYDADAGTCNISGEETVVGSYCNSNGSLYVVYNVTESVLCYPGNDESPIQVAVEDGIIVAKEKSINYWTEEGHYAIDSTSYKGLNSTQPVSSIFVKCEFGGKCAEEEPEVGSYINKSVEGWNIVSYPAEGVEYGSTTDKKCTVNDDETCTSTEDLDVGDVCIASSAIYLVASQGKCIKSEKSLVKYKYVNSKLYMLNDDYVIQKYDGFFFIGDDGRAISNVKDYAKKGTHGYICNPIAIGGKCSDIKKVIKKVKYFIDHNTKNEEGFVVVKFDPSKKSKREEEGSSSYESIDEEGIYKTDDGFVKCEYNENDEITCHEIDEEGTKMTEDGEVFTCKREEVEEEEKGEDGEDEEEGDGEEGKESKKGKVVCTQETKGGYYVVDGELYDCELNEEKDGLDCKKMDKEGYFLSSPDDVLYQCVEKEEEPEETTSAEDDGEGDKISNRYNEVNAEGDAAVDDKGEDSNDENTTKLDDVVDSDDETTSSTAESSTTETESSTSTTESTTTDTPTPTSSDEETPLDVECKVVECSDEPIVNEDGKELYVCRKVDDEGKWEPQQDCSSGNFVKVDDDYYSCEDEDEKGEIPPENVDQPNKEHTVDEPTETSTTESTTEEPTSTSTEAEETTTTTTTTTVTTTTAAEESTNTTTTSTTTKAEESSTTTTTTTTTGDAAPTTTENQPNSSSTTTSTTKPTDSPADGSGASSLIRNIPSLFFYLILFSFTYMLFI